jgi:Flp pilus assembly pilin Flp
MTDEHLDDRLRKHLQRVADQPAPRDLEARILAQTDTPKSAFNSTLYGIMIAVTALALILVLTLSGHETSNTFSTISNSLNTN